MELTANPLKERKIVLDTPREEEMIKQIKEFINWKELEEKLSPTDQETYNQMKMGCQALMASESPDHEEVSKRIKIGQEFLITNPSLDLVSVTAREKCGNCVSYCMNSRTNVQRSYIQ